MSAQKDAPSLPSTLPVYIRIYVTVVIDSNNFRNSVSPINIVAPDRVRAVQLEQRNDANNVAKQNGTDTRSAYLFKATRIPISKPCIYTSI